MHQVMKVGFAIGRVFAVLAVAGLVLAPIARPAMALAMATDMHATMVDGMAAGSAGMGTTDDMPCCPSKPALPDCSKDCPLMALCVTAPIHFVSQTGLTVPLTFVAVVFPGARSDLVSIAQAPPRKPPKL
jgi:hypothetical protein